MADPVLIKGCTIVNEGESFRGSILISAGLIDAVLRVDEENPAGLERKGIRVIDASGKYLLPGVIDDHVHFREPGLTHKGDMGSESHAAVAGGVTSFMDMPNTVPKATTLALLEEKFRIASEKSLANYSFFLGASSDNLKEIEKADRSKICGLKLFLGSSTGNMLVSDPGLLGDIFRNSPLIIAIHSEDERIIQRNLASFREKYGENIPVEAHPLIRNEDACFISTERAVELASRFNCRLHVLHVSTARELELFDNLISLEEKKITAEVCVHHLLFDSGDYKKLGARIKWNPAIKSKEDKEALLEGLLKDKIDLVATDHAPHTLEEKLNSYENSPSGGPMIQHSLVAMIELYKQGKITLERIVDKMSHAPAILYRIDRRGFIRKGFHADLVLVDLDTSQVVNKGNLLYKCGWSPLEGYRFHSSVMQTFVNGNLVYDRGRFNETSKGSRLAFNN